MNMEPRSRPANSVPHTHELPVELQRLGVRLGTGTLAGPTRSERPAPPGIEHVLPGQVCETPYGPCFVIEQRYPLEHHHGAHVLADLCPTGHPSELLARLTGDERVAAQEFRSAVFVDIETTSLGTAAGCCAFLVGVGVLEGNEFCLRQLFMRDYDEEEALLYLLEQETQGRAWWISFNGRNFDLPVLQTRFTCALREMPLARAPHLDLLYPARRLWRRRLTSCALSALEGAVLGVWREGDVPGWMVPDMYFEYLRSGDALPLRPVFVHNALDVLSLVTLAAMIDAILREPPGAMPLHPTDLYSLGAIHESRGWPELAVRAYEQVVEQAPTPDLFDEALFRLGALYKKAGEMEQATRVWHMLRERGHTAACVELAKDCEHRQRDCRAAALHVCAALSHEDLPDTGLCSREALQGRLARLRKKIGEGGLPMPHIESYSFGKIEVDSQRYDKDLLILPGGVRPAWRRKAGHALCPDDLQDVLAARPSALVIGTGNPGMMQVPQETLDWLATQGLRVEVYPTATACKRYNELAKAEQAAAALHLTC